MIHVHRDIQRRYDIGQFSATTMIFEKRISLKHLQICEFCIFATTRTANTGQDASTRQNWQIRVPGIPKHSHITTSHSSKYYFLIGYVHIIEDTTMPNHTQTWWASTKLIMIVQFSKHAMVYLGANVFPASGF